LLPKVKENVSLAKYTTFKIGGPARYFFVAKTAKDVILGIKAAKKCKIPFFILGAGSNLLVADEGYNGLIIKIKNQKPKIKNTNLPRTAPPTAGLVRGQKSPKQSLRDATGQAKIIECGAGVKLADLVKLSLDRGLTGLEWAAGIPGTVGGAIYGNAGAFGGSMGSVVESLKVLKASGFRFQVLSFKNKYCKFGYRDSIFKYNKNLIILSCGLQLERGDKKEIENEIKENLKKRKKTQPLDFPSAGSIFKNFTPPTAGPTAGPKLFKELEKFKKTGIIPAAYLIEKCAISGKKIGGAKISKKHANFILNSGEAKATDVKKLIDLIRKKVENKFGIILEEEICYLGFPK